MPTSNEIAQTIGEVNDEMWRELGTALSSFDNFNYGEIGSHWFLGGGASLSVNINNINHGIEPLRFNDIQELANNHTEVGTIYVSSTQSMQVGVDDILIYNNVTAKTEGYFTRYADGNYSYHGLTSILPDTFNFNPSTHRSGFLEFTTAVGNWIEVNSPATLFTINIDGTVTISHASGDVTYLPVGTVSSARSGGFDLVPITEETNALDVLAPDIREQFCFTSGTLIRMADGSEKPIETIIANDQILAFDANAHEGRGGLVTAKVVQTFIKHEQKVIDFHGVKVTPGHVFLNGEGKFQKLEDILAEDGTVVLEDGLVVSARTGRPANANDERPLSAVGAAVSESAVQHVEALHTVYNFEVEGLHTYVAAGYRVHNDSQWVIDTAGSIGQTFGTMLVQEGLYASVDNYKNTTCALDVMHATMQ